MKLASELDLHTPQESKKRKREASEMPKVKVDREIQHGFNNCAREDNPDNAIALFEKVCKEGKALNSHMYNVLLHLLSKHERNETFFQVYVHLKKSDLKLDETAVASFTKACAQTGDIMKGWEETLRFAV